MKHFIIVVTIVMVTSLFSMETAQNNNGKYYIIIKNSLPAHDSNVPNPHIDISDKEENIKNITSKGSIITHSLDRTTVSLQPDKEITIPLTAKAISAAFDLKFNVAIIGDNQPLKFNHNYGPLKFGDSIDFRLIDYFKEEKAIGLFCNNECITFFPLKK